MIILWLLFLPVAFGGKISPFENQWLKNNCGKSSSVAGTATEQHMPFLAALNMVFPPGYGFRPSVSQPFCTGAQISSRHILTAAHCFFVTDEVTQLCNYNVPFEKIKPEQWTEDTGIILGSRCTDPMCWDNEYYYRPVKITLHPYYNPCASKKFYDMALVEVDSEISTAHGEPICLPEPWEEVPNNTKLFSAGYGLNEYSSTMQLMQYNDYAEKEMLIEAPYESSELRRGDSGGPLFYIARNGTNVLLGVMHGRVSRTNTITIKSTDGRVIRQYGSFLEKLALFNDVRKQLDWICELTGICPVQQSGNNVWHPRQISK